MSKYIPAGAGEKMQYIVHPYNDNTLRFVLRYPGLLQPDAMKRAVVALTGSVPVLHASFEANTFGARWKIHPQVDESACFECMDTVKDPLETAVDRALGHVAADSAAQMRCILVQGERESALTILLSHLCVDGRDAVYLIKKLTQAYDLALQNGNCDALQVKNGSRAAEQVYRGLSVRERLKLLRDPRTGIRSVFSFPDPEEGRPVAIRRMIDEPVMAEARKKAGLLGASVNDLLLTACYRAFSALQGVDGQAPLSIMSMMDLRRHCPGGDSQGLSNLSGSLPTALSRGVCGSFEETLTEIAAQTGRIKQDPLAGLYGMPLLHGAARMMPMGVLMAVASRLYGSMSVGMTNLGRVDCRDLSMSGMIPSEGWFGGPIKKKPGMQVSAASFGGACSLGIWGYAARRDEAALRGMLDGMVQQVTAFAVRGQERRPDVS